MNERWLNVLAVGIVGVVLILSGTLMATTPFPDLDVVATAIYLAAGLVAFAGIGATVLRLTARRHPKPAVVAWAESKRSHWRMPPLTLVRPVKWSAGTRLGMLALRGHLVIGAILLIVKAVQLSRL